MDSTDLLVSAIITTHNRAELIGRALESVIAQTYSNIEIVVVNDGSTDNTEEVIKSYGREHELVYLKNNVSKGAPAARNRGIREATGQFIAGLDDDDEWHPERIRCMMDAFEKKWAYISSDSYYVTPRQKGIVRRNPVITYQQMLYLNAAGNQILVPRERLLDLGGFDEELLAAQDYDLFLRLNERYGNALNIKRPLQTVYMDHENEQRISNNAFIGYLQFYNKHRHRFNREQRRYQLFKIRETQGKNDGIRKILSYCPRKFLLKELLEYVKIRLKYK